MVIWIRNSIPKSPETEKTEEVNLALKQSLSIFVKQILRQRKPHSNFVQPPNHLWRYIRRRRVEQHFPLPQADNPLTVATRKVDIVQAGVQIRPPIPCLTMHHVVS